VSAEGKAFHSLAFDLVGRLPLLNILANNGNWRFAAASCKIVWRPQSPTPYFFADVWVILLDNFFANH
jgi:hypothetical protein